MQRYVQTRGASPLTVGEPADALQLVDLEFGTAGAGVFGWELPQGGAVVPGAGRPETRSQLASRRSTGAYEATREVAHRLIDVEAYAGTRAVYLREETLRGVGDFRECVELQLSYGRTGGSIEPLRLLDRYDSSLVEPAISANDDGQIAVAYVESEDERDLLRLDLRSLRPRLGDPGQRADHRRRGGLRRGRRPGRRLPPRRPHRSPGAP